MQNDFGKTLKHWRAVRRMSQLDLGLAADVSSRHISFLESGRSKPSRPMVMQLSETLTMPREACNTLLTAAGFARAYTSRTLESPELSVINQAIQRMISTHDPYPAMVIDRHWNLVDANSSGRIMLQNFGVGVGDSLLDATLAQDGVRALIDNWAEVGYYMMQRLRTESDHLGGDPILDQAATTLAQDADVNAFSPPVPLPPIIPARYKVGDRVVSFFSTIAQFGSAEDIALADLRIELLFPADETTRLMLNPQ